MKPTLFFSVLTFLSVNLFSQSDDAVKILNYSLTEDPNNPELLAYRGIAFMEKKITLKL